MKEKGRKGGVIMKGKYKIKRETPKRIKQTQKGAGGLNTGKITGRGKM